jgi:hypothetical protein
LFSSRIGRQRPVALAALARRRHLLKRKKMLFLVASKGMSLFRGNLNFIQGVSSCD